MFLIKLVFSYFLAILLFPVLSSVIASEKGTAIATAQKAIRINLLPGSEPSFSKCEVGGTYDTLQVNQVNWSEATELLLTDGDPNTRVHGTALLNISFVGDSSHLENNPGPDLMITEIAGPEPFNASLLDPNTGTDKSLLVKTNPSGNRTSCNVNINNAFIDISDFGISTGSNITSIRIDNLGGFGEERGSDIAEVSTIEPSLRAEVTSSAPGNITGKSPFCITYSICP